MSEPIKPGDLVQVVRWPCCGTGNIGMVFVVSDLFNVGFECAPHGCNRVTEGPVALGHKLAAPVAWVRRIPPLSALENEKREEELPLIY